MAKNYCNRCRVTVYGDYCPKCNNLVSRKIYSKEDTSSNHPSHKPKEYWCPYCNLQIVNFNNKFCDCGWEINYKSAMTFKIFGWLWENHKKFINEYRYMKDKGLVKNEYEYFKLKVGNTDIGKLIVSKVEHGYSEKEQELRKLSNVANNYCPEEWK